MWWWCGYHRIRVVGAVDPVRSFPSSSLNILQNVVDVGQVYGRT